MAALRTCIDDLLAGLGIDRAQESSISRDVRPTNQLEWARRMQQGLPRQVTREAKNGSARLRLVVGPEGKPTECKALGNSNGSTFGSYACESALKHARFEPAIDANGQAVVSLFVTTVTYDDR